MAELTKYDLALIGIKLLAIYLGLEMLGSLPSWVITLSTLYSQGPAAGVTYPFTIKFLAILLPLLTLLIPILLWLLANEFAEIITKRTAKMTSRPDTPLDMLNLQAMVFSAMGILIFIVTAPEFLAWIYAYVRAYIITPRLFQPQFPPFPLLVALVLKLVLSLVLILSSSTLSAALLKLRHRG
ncbi:MAG: hypothetical protein H0W64_10845 [Gammaproteobacteria bacterium]|nr:hypothetical protein [Gammaproteobacteria bacterium]